MDKKAAELLISELYEYIMRRNPGIDEREQWVQKAVRALTPEAAAEVVRAFYMSNEFKAKNSVKTIFPPGHFHSPVVDPKSVVSYVARERTAKPSELQGIKLNCEEMRKTWLANLEFIRRTPFTDDPSPQNRYNYLGGPYPWGDAITLRMMVNHIRPKRIIEIGSGYSSACMLDAVDEVGIPDFHMTCIEPFPVRLSSLLRTDDWRRVTLVKQLVQEVDVSIIDTLEAGDILFIDSTHVLKTASDVHLELFHILPRVKSGVAIHFHDIGYPFEYPDKWIYEKNYSWNEAYALRAFLMFNAEFRIIFWNCLFANLYAAEIAVEFPTFMRNPGTSIWIERSA